MAARVLVFVAFVGICLANSLDSLDYEEGKLESRSTKNAIDQYLTQFEATRKYVIENMIGECWKEGSYVPWNTPARCPHGFTNMGLTCYRGAVSTYHGSLMAQCPSGFRNMGAHCQGTRWNNWWHTQGMNAMTCPPGYYKSGARCYVTCPQPSDPHQPGDHWTNTGEYCLRHANTLSGGLSRMTCANPDYPVQVAGICYKRCREEEEFVGISCTPKCPKVYGKTWTNCGASCGASTAACVGLTIGKVYSVVMAIIKTGGCVATLGKGCLASQAANVKKALTTVGKIKQLLKFLYLGVTVLAAAAKAGSLYSSDPRVIALRASITAAQVMQIALIALDLGDPTGIVNVAQAFAKPRCVDMKQPGWNHWITFAMFSAPSLIPTTFPTSRDVKRYKNLFR